MTEQEWNESIDPVAMLDWLTANHKPSDRKLRLWVMACRSLEIFRSRKSERYTHDGKDLENNQEALESAVYCWKTVSNATGAPGLPERSRILRDIIGNPWKPVTLGELQWNGPCEPPQRIENPKPSKFWRPAWVSYGPPWEMALALAQAAYDERLPDGTLDNERLMILSDALEEAGLMDNPLLAHLRTPGPHHPGCWAVDLILGKE